MRFNGLEISAITKLAKAMVLADGKVQNIEIAVMTKELARFGVQESQLQTLLAAGDAMDMTKAMAVVSTLDYEHKKYVSAYLGTIMAADFDIDDTEMALWRLISTLCELPTMNVQEAVSIMAEL